MTLQYFGDVQSNGIVNINEAVDRLSMKQFGCPTSVSGSDCTNTASQTSQQSQTVILGPTVELGPSGSRRTKLVGYI